jgi:Sec-independent protein translocase protein TatA
MPAALPIYAREVMTYEMAMPGLSMSELAIVAFILLLVTLAGRLPRWGESLGSYLYKRANPAQAENADDEGNDGGATRTSATRTTGSSSQPPTHT